MKNELGLRVDGLTHKICEERADELTFKIDEDGADGWTDKTCEERADGWTCRNVVEQVLVDGDEWWMQCGSSRSLHRNSSEELMAWVASMVASMASNGGVDGVDGGGFDGVDGGGLVASTQRALTWKSLCLPSSEFDTHRGSLLSV